MVFPPHHPDSSWLRYFVRTTFSCTGDSQVTGYVLVLRRTAEEKQKQGEPVIEYQTNLGVLMRDSERGHDNKKTEPFF